MFSFPFDMKRVLKHFLLLVYKKAAWWTSRTSVRRN